MRGSSSLPRSAVAMSLHRLIAADDDLLGIVVIHFLASRHRAAFLAMLPMAADPASGGDCDPVPLLDLRDGAAGDAAQLEDPPLGQAGPQADEDAAVPVVRYVAPLSEQGLRLGGRHLWDIHASSVSALHCSLQAWYDPVMNKQPREITQMPQITFTDAGHATNWLT